MGFTPAALAALCLAAIAWSTWRGARGYARFKALTDTVDRQRFYRSRLIGGFLLFFGGSLLVLALLGSLGDVLREPRALWSLSRGLATLPTPLVLGASVGFSISVVSISLALRLRQRSRGGSARTTPVLGDILPLLPRNATETWWTGALSLNAGVGEELFFRLTLPLVLTLTFGNALVGFALAVAVFGAAHLYQGWVGVIATGALGALFAVLYLATGSLILPMVMHVAVDLIGLVVRPILRRRAADASQG